MGTTFSKLNKLIKTKAAIRQAIINKGVEVSEDTAFADYPGKINAIASDDSGESGANDAFFNTITRNNKDYSYLFSNYLYTRIPDLSDWDSSTVTDMSYMFNNAIFYYNTSIDLSSWNTGSLTNIERMFSGCENLSSLNLANWNTSKVTNMYCLFYGCIWLSSIDLTGWDTSNVTNMGGMFYKTFINPSISLTHFNTSKVTDMQYMFYKCEYLEQLNLTGWDTSNVTNMNSMFEDCTRLCHIYGELDASKVNGLYNSTTVGALPTSLSPFTNCDSLETLYLRNIYKDISTLSNNSKWSINLRNTKVKDECLIYIINQLPNLYNKGLSVGNTNKIYLYLPSSNTLTQEQVQPALDKGWQVSSTNY